MIKKKRAVKHQTRLRNLSVCVDIKKLYVQQIWLLDFRLQIPMLIITYLTCFAIKTGSRLQRTSFVSGDHFAVRIPVIMTSSDQIKEMLLATYQMDLIRGSLKSVQWTKLSQFISTKKWILSITFAWYIMKLIIRLYNVKKKIRINSRIRN